jgi:rubrerythrin
VPREYGPLGVLPKGFIRQSLSRSPEQSNPGQKESRSQWQGYALYGQIERQLDDEKSAIGRYDELARLASDAELPDIAEKLRQISKEESSHYDRLIDIREDIYKKVLEGV